MPQASRVKIGERHILKLYPNYAAPESNGGLPVGSCRAVEVEGSDYDTFGKLLWSVKWSVIDCFKAKVP